MKKINFILVLLFCLLGYRVANAGIFDSIEEKYKKAYISWYMCSCKQLYSDDCAKLDNKEQLLAQKLRLKDYTWEKIEILRDIARLENNLPKHCTSPYDIIKNNLQSLGLTVVKDNLVAFDTDPLEAFTYAIEKNATMWYIFSLEDIKKIRDKKVIPYRYGLIERSDRINGTVALTFEQLRQYISPYVSKKLEGRKFFNIENEKIDKKFDINFINDLNDLGYLRDINNGKLHLNFEFTDIDRIEKFSKKYQLPVQRDEYDLIDYLIKTEIISDLPVYFSWAND